MVSIFSEILIHWFGCSRPLVQSLVQYLPTAFHVALLSSAHRAFLDIFSLIALHCEILITQMYCVCIYVLYEYLFLYIEKEGNLLFVFSVVKKYIKF